MKATTLTKRQRMDFLEELLKEDVNIKDIEHYDKLENDYNRRVQEKKYDKHLTGIIHKVKKINKCEYLF